MTDARPDPDALLRQVHEAERRARRGKLKVFFGAAPGVGKTYRMLQVARDLAYDQKLDLVIGLVETHKRFETAALMLGLELLPRRVVSYRGHELEEFDLDAALARRPELLLLDELAHTNAPGSRHAKRWQDVDELLDAGIDVYTTVNVQHLESLNDVIAQITGVKVRETLPDSVLDEADHVELVDITPEELLTRLNEGKVYLASQIQQAARHFFRRGNLLALRELALRRTAQHVDQDVLAYREAHGVHTPWPAAERILVCVGPAPSSARLIRAAARMAAGVRCPWVAAYVETSSLGQMSEADRDRLEAHLRLAESLGAQVVRLSGASVATALLDFARRQNVTRIVIGKPTHAPLKDRLRGSLLDEVVRGSGDIDVQVISGADARRDPPKDAPRAPVDPPAYGKAALAVALTAGVAATFRAVLPVPDLEVLFLLTVVVAAIRWGRGPAILAAFLGVAAYDFFFVPPFFTFAVVEGAYFLTFAIMFGVGLLVSELTTKLRRQEQDALAREERTLALFGLSRALSAVDRPEDAAQVVSAQLAQIFNARCLVLSAEGPLEILARTPPEATLAPKELGVARWCLDHGQLAGRGTDTLPGAATLCAPLCVGTTPQGVLALERPAPLRLEQRELLEACCRQAAFAIERATLAERARAAALKARTEELRSALLSAVSHDLRTPIAAITGTATALRDAPDLPTETRLELLESVCDEAERLERLVANLLDMTRLESGVLALKQDFIPLEEIAGGALLRLERRLGPRPITVDYPPQLPFAFVDPVIFEQLFVNLLENAAKYTPPGTPLHLAARVEDGRLALTFEDEGPGLPAGLEERLFEKFVRGDHGGAPGVGLGLAICRAIAEAHGGAISAKNRPEGGACFTVTLPIKEESHGS